LNEQQTSELADTIAACIQYAVWALALIGAGTVAHWAGVW